MMELEGSVSHKDTEEAYPDLDSARSFHHVPLDQRSKTIPLDFVVLFIFQICRPMPTTYLFKMGQEWDIIKCVLIILHFLFLLKLRNIFDEICFSFNRILSVPFSTA